MVRIILINVIDSKCAGRCIKPQCDSQTVSEGRWEIVSSSILWRTTFNGARTRSREGASVQRQRQPRRQAPRGEKSTARAIAKLKPIRLLCRKMMGGRTYIDGILLYVISPFLLSVGLARLCRRPGRKEYLPSFLFHSVISSAMSDITLFPDGSKESGLAIPS